MSKRLTDAELAAEYWRLRADHNGMARITDSPIEIDRKATIMHRFATTPNAFEGAQQPIDSATYTDHERSGNYEPDELHAEQYRIGFTGKQPTQEGKP